MRWMSHLLLCSVLPVLDAPAFCFAGYEVAIAHPNLQRDIATFTTRRDLCDHFRGEEPYNAARAREIAAKVKRYCIGTDRELQRLRKKYAHNPRVLKTLNAYEDTIE
jgi:hypothetical protein